MGTRDESADESHRSPDAVGRRDAIRRAHVCRLGGDALGVNGKQLFVTKDMVFGSDAIPRWLCPQTWASLLSVGDQFDVRDGFIW